ncbi:MAG TPA: MlaD family protein [Actinomycetota bacterium]|nr:MlaD family protein [Actinomycetota bacterium]
MTGSLPAVVFKLVVFAIFTVLVTGMLAAVIGNYDPFNAYYDVDVEFSDATGLLRNDVVKIAGVNVGKVTGARISREPGKEDIAEVTVQVRSDVDLPSDVRAAIRFRNLLGQRMVVFYPGDRGSAPMPKDGRARVPVAQTTPAFDLSVVFNNLRPVLQNLDPEDANVVSRAIVEIFSGREAQTQRTIAQLADLAETLGDRGPVAAELVADLDVVVTNLAQREAELRSVLGSFDQLMATLAGRSGELGRVVDNVGSMSQATAALVAENRPGLDQMIAQLRDILAVASAQRAELDTALKALPGATHGLLRATTYGEWANLIGVCVDGVGCPEAEGTAGAMAHIFAPAAGVRR